MLVPLLLFLAGARLLAAAFPPLPRSYTLRLLQTSTFQDGGVDTEGLGLLDDIELGVLEHRTWAIRFLQPWVRPALPRGDWDAIEDMVRIYLNKFHHLVWAGAVEKGVPFPFVAQCTAGCELFPNGSSKAFAYVAYDGRDFLSYDMGSGTWLLRQDTDLARYVRETLRNYTAFTELVEVLFNSTCVDDVDIILHYAKEALERQVKPVAVVFAKVPNPARLLLVCRVTGFYPRPVSVAWLRDGQEVPPGPELSATPPLPNADLTYQLRSILAVAPRDGHRYACRVQHSSLGGRSLLVPWGNSGVILPAGLAAATVVLVAATATAVVVWMRRRRKYQEMDDSERSSSVRSH
ncbi:T-cell surface glycoprotein CD1b-3-like [Dromaius novaehollandiae]|uniref:T-cell surface glycoprotein CD1b-3-like n=1 Tax=Dromaius novaehollandiae TaxID=8790 RepID=A0A8C4IVZ9_DRONO|nr:T-cell surface glycoprotein CD1b-3-like [Dromaius novaehollandiae]